MRRSTARNLAAGAIGATMLLEVASAVACRDHDPVSLLLSLALLLIPLAPALIAAVTPNPLCSLFAAAPVAGWIVFAFATECLHPDQRAPGSTMYLGVWFYGLTCGALGAVVALPLLRLAGIRVQAG